MSTQPHVPLTDVVPDDDDLPDCDADADDGGCFFPGGGLCCPDDPLDLVLQSLFPGHAHDDGVSSSSLASLGIGGGSSPPRHQDDAYVGGGERDSCGGLSICVPDGLDLDAIDVDSFFADADVDDQYAPPDDCGSAATEPGPGSGLSSCDDPLAGALQPTCMLPPPGDASQPHCTPPLPSGTAFFQQQAPMPPVAATGPPYACTGGAPPVIVSTTNSAPPPQPAVLVLAARTGGGALPDDDVVVSSTTGMQPNFMVPSMAPASALQPQNVLHSAETASTTTHASSLLSITTTPSACSGYLPSTTTTTTSVVTTAPPPPPPPPVLQGHARVAVMPWKQRSPPVNCRRKRRPWLLDFPLHALPVAPPPGDHGNDDDEDGAKNTCDNSAGAASTTGVPRRRRRCPVPRQRNRQTQRVCSHCHTPDTPQWRAGPNGPGTLCNACGIRFVADKLLPEYRPSTSPSFQSGQHSNRHRNVVKLREQKEKEKENEKLEVV